LGASHALAHVARLQRGDSNARRLFRRSRTQTGRSRHKPDGASSSLFGQFRRRLCDPDAEKKMGLSLNLSSFSWRIIGPTLTVVAIGPDKPERIYEVTYLQLY